MINQEKLNKFKELQTLADEAQKAPLEKWATMATPDLNYGKNRDATRKAANAFYDSLSILEKEALLTKNKT